jgi:hypothetical protein
MFCPICATPIMTCAFLTMLYQLPYATVVEVHSSNAQSYKQDIVIFNNILKVSHMVHIQTALYFSMAPNVKTCSVTFYTMLKAEMSIHQEIVTMHILTFYLVRK